MLNELLNIILRCTMSEIKDATRNKQVRQPGMHQKIHKCKEQNTYLHK